MQNNQQGRNYYHRQRRRGRRRMIYQQDPYCFARNVTQDFFDNGERVIYLSLGNGESLSIVLSQLPKFEFITFIQWPYNNLITVNQVNYQGGPRHLFTPPNDFFDAQRQMLYVDLVNAKIENHPATTIQFNVQIQFLHYCKHFTEYVVTLDFRRDLRLIGFSVVPLMSIPKSVWIMNHDMLRRMNFYLIFNGRTAMPKVLVIQFRRIWRSNRQLSIQQAKKLYKKLYIEIQNLVGARKNEIAQQYLY